MKLRAPNVLVLMTSILVLMAMLTWIIPAGTYRTEKKQIPGVGERSVVYKDENNKTEYNPHERKEIGGAVGFAEGMVVGNDTRQGAWQVLQAPLRGFGVHDAWETIGFILLIGGAFGVLNRTGSITAFLMWLVNVTGHWGRFAMIPVLMFAFSAGGMSFGMAEESIAFAMITVPLAVRLKFDTITGIAIPFIGSQAGFATAFVNPFTFQIAKQIAGSPMSDGYTFRVVVWVIVTLICTTLVTWHAWRVYKDPSKSLTPEVDQRWRDKVARDEDDEASFSASDLGVIVVFVAFMVLLCYGSIELGWYITEMAAIFLGMCVLCGLIGKLDLRTIADSFMEGAKDLAPTAILLAFARGILLIAEEGMIIHPILRAASDTLGDLGPLATTECMYGIQSFINFFVPSGSGQAALTMPIMAPLADLRGVPLDDAVMAYQFGDGFTNIIIPTNPVLMGVITAAGVGYGTWFKWVWKLQVVLLLTGAILLAFK